MSSSKWEAVPHSYNPLKAGSIDGTDVIPHDHGIIRAMQAEYKPNRLVVGDPKATVFVGRLNLKTEEETLKRLFSKSGDIKRLRLVRDIVTGFSKGYAFVEYYDKYDASRAIRDHNHTILDDKEIFVEYECERVLSGWIPRRLGGGLGGRKESGQLRFGGVERPFKKPIPLNENEKKSNWDRHSRRDQPYSRDKYNSHHYDNRRNRHRS